MPRSRRQVRLRSFASAWLAGESVAQRFLGNDSANLQSRIDAVRRAAGRRCDAGLVEDLVAQHAHLPPSAARRRHLEQLGTGGAATIVSGQQAGLFGGPALTLFKAAGVVAAARQLSRESSIPCVPVFWLQTEDHDWDEIDHCFVHSPAGTTECIRAESQGESPRTSVAARVYGRGLETAMGELTKALAGRPHVEETVAVLGRHYRSDVGPGEALRGLLAELFADDGLVLLDPRRPAVAALARTVLSRSLTEAERFSTLLTKRALELEESGLAIQVPVRPGAPLCFLHPDAPSGPRYRLEPRGRHWRLCDDDREVRTEDVLELHDKDPLHLSTSALLRPIVQDTLLPNAMVLAGPGEISYFAQLGPLYEAYGIDMPLVAARPSFCVTAPGDRRRLEDLRLEPSGLCGKRDDVLSRLCDTKDDPFTPSRVEESLVRDFHRQLDALTPRALAIDKTLARPIDKARAAVDQSVRRLADKYRSSLLHRDEVLVDRVDRLRTALAPEGAPQERCYGLASLGAEHGIGKLLEAIRSELQPFDGRTRELAL